MSSPRPKNVHGNTVDALGAAIVAGRYPAGGSLPQEGELCETLGVSRTVVREATKSLVAKGLLVTGPKLGTRVLPPEQWNWFDSDVIGWQAQAGFTPEFLRDLMDLRAVVEPAAIRMAAERASAEDIAGIERAYAGMKAAIEGRGDYIPSDLRFHQGLMRASGNRMLAQMSRALSAILQTSFELSTQEQGGTISSLPLHRAVLDAVIARDPDAAERAIRVLIDDAKVHVTRVLERADRLS